MQTGEANGKYLQKIAAHRKKTNKFGGAEKVVFEKGKSERIGVYPDSRFAFLSGRSR